MKICVFGAASPSINSLYFENVELLGRELAQRGHDLVFGAGANGLMGAVARGVKSGGGKITGVIPTFFREESIEAIYEECDKLIYTDTMHRRKQEMEDAADGFIVVPGGIGTFEEFYEILTLKQLRRHNKPIAVYNLNGFYNDMIAAMENAVKDGFIKESCRSLYMCSDSREDILNYVENVTEEAFAVKDLKEG